MFPFDIEDDEVELTEEEEKEPSDYEIDFITGKLTGKIVTGLDAIVQWVKIVLSIDRYYYTQYSWDCGHELSELIGKHYDDAYLKSEVYRMISDALTMHPDITGIENMECNITGDRLTVHFDLITTYGGATINV